jgi:hypothetical protein
MIFSSNSISTAVRRDKRASDRSRFDVRGINVLGMGCRNAIDARNHVVRWFFSGLAHPSHSFYPMFGARSVMWSGLSAAKYSDLSISKVGSWAAETCPRT